VVCVFARKTSEPLTSLVKQIDSKIGENDKLKSFVVILTQDGEKVAEDLKKLASSASIKNVPLTLHGDPAEVPDYELSKDADVTVVMWTGHKVKAARGFKGELTEENIRDIMSDLPKILSD
jgi:nucleotide-binding universal stress UspA family protein